jgi:hypothetical protein
LIRCYCAADYAATPRHFDYFAIDFAIAAFTPILLSPLFRHFRHYCRFIDFSFSLIMPLPRHFAAADACRRAFRHFRRRFRRHYAMLPYASIFLPHFR